MAIKKYFINESFRIQLQPIKNKFLLIKSVLTSESRNPAWDRNTSSCYKHNLVITHHCFDCFFHRNWNWFRSLIIFSRSPQRMTKTLTDILCQLIQNFIILFFHLIKFGISILDISDSTPDPSECPFYPFQNLDK